MAVASAEQYLELAEVAGGFIHEIKNHLNTLSMNLQLLAEDFENPSSPRERKSLERVNRLTDECRRLVELSNDFLRYARVSELKARPCDLNEVIARMIDFLAPTARAAGVEVNAYTDRDLPRVNLDTELFDKVLLNLMLNAEDSMPDGGTLTVQTTSCGAWVHIDIIDTGCGIDDDLIKRIFKPFVTTKPDGHGLGLALAKKIVLAHHGTIEVQSTPGRGTKFTVRLPALTSGGHAAVCVG